MNDTKKVKIIVAAVLVVAALAVALINVLNLTKEAEKVPEPENEQTEYQMSEKSRFYHNVYNACYNYALGEDRMETDLAYDEAWLTDTDPSVVNAAKDGLSDGESTKAKREEISNNAAKRQEYYNAAYNHALGQDKLKTSLVYDEAWLNDPDEVISKAAKEGLVDGEADKKIYDSIVK